VKPALHCLLMAAFEGGEGVGGAGSNRRRHCTEAGEGLEVEDGADGRAPSVSGREGERALVGRCGFVGRKRSWAARAGKKGREREERAGLWWAVCGPKASAGPRMEKKRRG
jgi:hypothetical protein